jgi:DNA-binding CsgD family transcriptional regulator
MLTAVGIARGVEVTAADIGLIGRDRELAGLSHLVDEPPATSRVQVLLGEPGVGKTALLAELTRRARSTGLQVLSVTGRVSERDLAFAGLHQLLRPVVDRLPALPGRQAKALLSAFALTDDPVPPDALLTGIAVLTLLSAVADESPLLVVVDDGQWLDGASLDSLAFAVRRLDTEPLVLLFAARGPSAPTGFDRDFDELKVPPLDTPQAGRLLDKQPRPPRGRAREHVLVQADGNPLALIELSKVIAADPSAGRRWTAEPLPLTERLTHVMADQFGVLAPSARAALLLAAVADSPGVAARIPGVGATTLAPAERAGLIRVEESGPQFTHPLIRAAVYHAVPFAERAAAHRVVAEVLRDRPDRRGWHLATAALEPDERLAALLEDTAMEAQRRGGAAAAARALERAAELSPAEADQARRLLAAAGLALAAGQADWVQDLARQVLAVTADPQLRLAARARIGWALVWSNQHAAALSTLLAVVEGATPDLPVVAWDAIGLAATVAYQSGAAADRIAVVRTLDRLSEPVQPPADWPVGLADEQRVWVRACVEPLTAHTKGVDQLHRIAAGPVTDLAKVGASAWLLDETQLAVELLRDAVSRLRAPGLSGASGAALSALEWACIDSGRWDEALAAAREAADAAAAYRMEIVAATADLCTATISALRGEHEEVPKLLASAATNTDAREYRSIAARACHAAGLSAFAQGNFGLAYAQLRQLFDQTGAPVHHHVSYLAIADLAAAAVRAGRRPDAKTLVERALAPVEETSGPRLHQLAARARALLAESSNAEAYFDRGLAEADGEQWPFERAQLRLDFGEWLRRQRRINEAKPVLASALETFRRLGAAPWSRRAEAELRACGVAEPVTTTSTDPLAELTAQQREIVILAARGLTNPEIGDRLFLSPRTVASHLYRAFPKLGIAGRHQLRDLIDPPHGS